MTEKEKMCEEIIMVILKCDPDGMTPGEFLRWK